MNAIPAKSKQAAEPLRVEVGEELHHCGICGTRTVDTAPSTVFGDRPAECPHCGQHYLLIDAEDEGGAPAAPFDVHAEFQGDLMPLVEQLSALCRARNCAMLTLIAPPPGAFEDPSQSHELLMHVTPYGNDMVPAAIYHTINHLQSNLSYAPEGVPNGAAVH